MNYIPLADNIPVVGNALDLFNGISMGRVYVNGNDIGGFAINQDNDLRLPGNARTLELRAAYQGLTFQNTKHMAGPYDLSNFTPGSTIVATCHVNLLHPDMLECSFTS